MKETKGQRHDQNTPDELWSLEPGEYGQNYDDDTWFIRVPQDGDFYAGMGNLNSHTITVHGDGTITAEPSILVTGHHDKKWHGYLRAGNWFEIVEPAAKKPKVKEEKS